RGAEGKFLPNKRAADAEGLAFKDGLALVSFEQTHGIEAFDLEGCGVAARAAPVATLPKRIDGKRIPANRGAEALSLGKELHIGFEMKTADGSPNALLLEDGSLSDFMFIEPGAFYAQTGADYADWGHVDLYRAYDPARGNRIKVEVRSDGAVIASAHLKPPLPVDNFEGVAFGTSPEGKKRVWLISDDNFNESQRTLLFALDLD
ncbi:MAG: esterase-like activity of phytase family protein, partial [Pseudomonadota bacterium]